MLGGGGGTADGEGGALEGVGLLLIDLERLLRELLGCKPLAGGEPTGDREGGLANTSRLP